MVQYIKVSEYAIQKGVSERTVRNWIQKGKLSTTNKIIDNRPTLVIIIDDNSEPSEVHSGSTEQFQPPPSGPIQDAEIVSNPSSYSLVSMEKTTFEQLIDSIKMMSEARADSDQQTIKKIETEYFESKAENKRLTEENKTLTELLMKEKILAAQVEANLKIKDIRILELEEKIKIIEEKLSEASEQQGKKPENRSLWKLLNNSQKL